MHIELVSLEISNELIDDRGAAHVLRWLRQRGIVVTLGLELRPSVFAPHAVRVSTSAPDVRAARKAGYGLVVAVAGVAAEEAIVDADLVIPGFARLPGALLSVMRSPRRVLSSVTRADVAGS